MTNEAAIQESNRLRALYGMRPWAPGIPVKDALGNSIVFRDDETGERYSIAHVDEARHCHVRVLMGDARDVGPHRHFEAHAETEMMAAMFASLWIMLGDVRGAKLVSKRKLARGGVALVYRKGEDLD